MEQADNEEAVDRGRFEILLPEPLRILAGPSADSAMSIFCCRPSTAETKSLCRGKAAKRHCMNSSVGKKETSEEVEVGHDVA